jgi:hypothetical protein
MLNKILNKFGYYKCDMPKGSVLSEGDILEMFSAYGDNEMFTVFLRDMCAQDKRLHFNASNDRDRYTLRGAHDRNLYFISLIKKSNDRKTKQTKGGK